MHDELKQFEYLTECARDVPSPASMTISQQKFVTYLDLSQSEANMGDFNAYNDSDASSKAVAIIENLSRNVDTLISEISIAAQGDTISVQYVLEACLYGLKLVMPILLDQARETLTSLTKGENNREAIGINQLRLQSALSKARSYLSHIQQALSMERSLQKPLAELFGIVSANLQEGEFRPSFSISSSLSSELLFIVSLGEVESIILSDVADDELPLMLRIQPLLEFSANESGFRDAKSSAMACKVSIERCTYRPRKDATVSGITGEISVRAQVSSLKETHANITNDIWAVNDSPVPILVIREATSFQHNAQQIKSKTRIDLFTSYEYGCSDVKISAVVPTYEAKKGLPRVVSLDLFLSTSR
jgi:hypothetical protein